MKVHTAYLAIATSSTNAFPQRGYYSCYKIIQYEDGWCPSAEGCM